MKDVLIIGAGPAGLHAARRLAESGLSTAVIDGQTRIGEYAICSGVIGAEAFARFGYKDCKVLNEIRNFTAVTPSGRKIQHHSDSALAYVVDKGEFNRYLARHAVSAGAELMLGQWAEVIESGRHEVSLRCRNRDGAERQIRSRAVILASGVNATLGKSLGLARPSEYLSAIQTDILCGTDGAALPTEVYLGRDVAPGAFGWKIPLGGGLIRVGLMCDKNPKPYFDNLLRHVAPGVSAREVTVSRKAIGQLPIGECAADRILVIGEAAGHVKTSTGGGIYYGLLSAELACETLLKSFRSGRLDKQALGDFDMAWRSNLGSELTTGYWARKLLGRLPDDLLDRTFDWLNTMDVLPRLNGKLKFDWHQKAILATVRNLLSLPVSS